MAYLINKTNGAVLDTVIDGAVIRSHAGISLIGKQVNNYGEIQNENFIRITENFSNSSPPMGPLDGQLWWNSTTKAMLVFSVNHWRPVTGFTANATPSVAPVLGDQWWDTAASQFKVYTGTKWLTIGPAYDSTTGLSGPQCIHITSVTGAVNSVTAIYDKNEVVSIISSAPAFTPATPMVGFATIPTGLSFNSTIADIKFNGTATSAENALQFGGLTVDQFMRSDTPTAVSGSITPDQAGIYDIGAFGQEFATVYARNFSGTAMAASYADLAERFAADAQYSPGTVVELGGEFEITETTLPASDKVFGVVSTAPAYSMNNDVGDDRTHPKIAVCGRVPVKVTGKAVKGDRLISAGGGMAKVGTNIEITPWNVIGRVLHDKLTDSIELVEAYVRINS